MMLPVPCMWKIMMQNLYGSAPAATVKGIEAGGLSLRDKRSVKAGSSIELGSGEDSSGRSACTGTAGPEVDDDASASGEGDGEPPLVSGHPLDVDAEPFLPLGPLPFRELADGDPEVARDDFVERPSRGSDFVGDAVKSGLLPSISHSFTFLHASEQATKSIATASHFVHSRFPK